MSGVGGSGSGSPVIFLVQIIHVRPGFHDALGFGGGEDSHGGVKVAEDGLDL